MINSSMLIYQSDDGLIKIDTKFENETIWLTLDQMSELFQRNKSTISRHIKNIYDDGELTPESTVAKFATVQNEGNREVTRNIDYYNLDVIILLAMRINSPIARSFEVDRRTINYHINKILETKELDDSVCQKNWRTGTDGKNYLVRYYNLDMIISVGYRVNSIRGIQFKRWASRNKHGGKKCLYAKRKGIYNKVI